MPIAAIILILATAVVFYALIGYPLLLVIWPSSKNAKPVAKDLTYCVPVSIIVAVYNGANFIRDKIKSLQALNYPPELVQIVVASDGSTDDTEQIVREFPGVILVPVPRGGKAAALNAALTHATGEVLFFTDVRQPIERDALRHLVANFADRKVGAVTGELQILNNGTGEQVNLDLYWRYELWARARHSQIDSIFTATGCIYAIRRSLVGPLPPDTLADDAMIPLRAFFQGYRVVFDPDAIAYDYPAAPGTEFRRKLRNLGGLWQLHARMPELFSGADRMRLHFLSHKFTRLLLPWAILTILVATFGLPASVPRTFLLRNEMLLVALAVLDSITPRWFPLKRLFSLSNSFFMLNLASLAGIIVFFVPPTKLWLPTRVSVQPHT